MQYISRLTNKELNEIIDDLSDKEVHIKKQFDFLELIAESEYRQDTGKCVISKAELLKILNNIDINKNKQKYYKINSDTLLKNLFI